MLSLTITSQATPILDQVLVRESWLMSVSCSMKAEEKVFSVYLDGGTVGQAAQNSLVVAKQSNVSTADAGHCCPTTAGS